MKILVIVKQVVSDPSVLNIRDNQIDFSRATFQTSTLDLVAIEQAVQLKEQGKASHLIACIIGGDMAEKSLRTAMAMGVDDGVHIQIDHHDLTLLEYALILQEFMAEHNFDLVLTGREDFDGGAGNSSGMLAGLLGWSYGDYITGIDEIGEQFCDIVCQSELGQQHLRLSMPSLLSVDSGLNSPRFVKFPQLIQARKRIIEQKKASDFTVGRSDAVKEIGVRKMPSDRKKIMLDNVADLAQIVTDTLKLK